ncbi:hypothetical protein [Mycolicibacillus koreensis]|uniref:hypothetical protein n=1 Tax=Mycolicibacillus koreensis TaxID=1069220 RepID=UPI00138D4724|nr:hypothetical protein [Mycolicibacillus koreensis]BBY55520.1 hypothetical protein MKOR_27710 [Mycolicibacillus koreensis]
MDIALGVSLATASTPAVRMVVIEGETADGVTVDRDEFDVAAGESVAEWVVEAIDGARVGAVNAGHRLTSIGVSFNDPIEADLLRDALARHQVDDVMVVSAFLAAVALTQSVGSETGHARTALLFVQSGTATLATVESSDGAIADVRRHRLVHEDSEEDLAEELANLVASVAEVPDPPAGVFVVGAGVMTPAVKSRLESATSLPVNVPGEPALALGRGAALASAHAPLFASSTRAMAWAQDFGTGSLDSGAMRAWLAALPSTVDYDGNSDNPALAYSAVPGAVEGKDPEHVDTAAAADVGSGESERIDSAMLDFRAIEEDPRGRLRLLVGGAGAVVAVAITALVISVVVGLDTPRSPDTHPGARVVPSEKAAPPKPQQPPPPKAPAPPPPEAPAPQAPAPAPENIPAPQTHVPQAPVVQAPAPANPAPAPPPPAAPPPPPPPPVIVPLPIPGLPDIGGPPRNRGGRDHDGPRRGGGHDHDDDGWRPPKIPIIGGGGGGHGHGHGRGGGKWDIPGIPGL